MKKCSICQCVEENDKVRYLDICITGSEGVYLCTKCEMDVVEHLRRIQSMAVRCMVGVLKRVKREKDAE
ncbi:MAG: hypothetical protein PHO67_07890 [Candidatus Omnitrophica bacterium]|nr:hypothetical protein [Candidatus Omnitrophota bacterium]